STPIAAFGTIDNLTAITPTFNATAVYAGTSLENPIAEFVSGVVTARSGNDLTLTGVTYQAPTGVKSYIASVPVKVGNSTLVTEDGVLVNGLTADAVSVGQQVVVAGLATLNAAGLPTEVDATSGQVRLQSTRLWGTLNSATASSATLNLDALDNLSSSGFNFAGTAADPAAYDVATGALDESAVPTGTLLQVDGIVAPFGSPHPDFTATAITPVSDTTQQLVIQWQDGSAAAQPFVSDGAAGIVIDPKNADLSTIHYLQNGPLKVDLNTLPAYPLITTVGADQSDLQLAVGSTNATNGISVFNSQAAFASGLNSALNGTNRVFRLVASGHYDAAANAFVATRINVALHE
ncbi:MAG: hypothetical protein JO361_11560, partial [Gammaproteobacteria bacterium]|nr:hypothetical protein [Gammaproteobacteria bacterium]